ncbi:hypothetical protein GCM10022255_114420 [Dactylosporangium darangshiense]|uniref:Uncharacterized protein n=1 Tax=Dactylosporangium darangshiense TaxID=579108 RepID=A0ABP8DVZ8_9ACTN
MGVRSAVTAPQHVEAGRAAAASRTAIIDYRHAPGTGTYETRPKASQKNNTRL